MRDSSHITRCVLVVLVIGAASHWALAGGTVDKSGVKPQVLHLPTGPGSIQGLGESFEPQLNSGTAHYQVPLVLPPGRSGFTPALAIIYDGGHGNGPVGIGWRLSTAYVQRKTDKGLPAYADTRDLFITEGGEDLVNVGNGLYRAQNETGFDRFERTDAGWKVTHRDGKFSLLGADAASRIQDGSHVFRWCISSQQDLNGNSIVYGYNEPSSFSNGEAPTDGQIYLTSIKYNMGEDTSHCMCVTLKYELRPVHDRLFDYRSRFAVQTTQRCIEIAMYENGVRVRSYKLRYDTGSTISRLVQIEQYGRDESQGPLASILSFQYTNFKLNSHIMAMNTGINPPVDLTSSYADIADMNGDGLPDLVYTGDVHQVFFNKDGHAWQSSYDVPGGFSEFKLDHANTMLMDMDGDGFTDLFIQDPSINGYSYFRGGQPNNGWALQPVQMANAPSFTFGDTTKPVDLDNDGRTDVIQKAPLSDQIGCVFNQKGLTWSGMFGVNAPSTRAEFDFGPEASSPLRLADMNGDGLQDFVVLSGEGYIWYFPGHGVTQDSATPQAYQGWDKTVRGAWAANDPSAEGYRMANAPDSIAESDFAEASNFRKMMLLDINGDGLADLVYVGNNRLVAWLNLGGDAFSDAMRINAGTGQIPGQDADTRSRTADMNGNGTVDIVWNRASGFTEVGHSEASWVYLDLTEGVRPNLLQRIDNGIGQVTTISYRSSTDYLVDDRTTNRTWAYKVPIAVNVIAEVDVSDGFNNPYVTRMFYHDGYYDGVQKEFRGFATAEKWEIGDDGTQPTLIMAHQFNVGDAYEVLKGKPKQIEARTDIAGGDANVFFRETHNWNARKLLDGANGDTRAVMFAEDLDKTQDEIELGSSTPVQLAWKYTYDDYGNTTQEIEYGRSDRNDDDREIDTSYTAAHESGLAAWILNKVVTRTTAAVGGAPVAAQKRNYYDGLVLGEVGKGNLTRTEDWISSDKYAVSVRNDYDGYGNVVATYDALWGAVPGHYRTACSRRRGPGC